MSSLLKNFCHIVIFSFVSLCGDHVCTRMTSVFVKLFPAEFKAYAEQKPEYAKLFLTYQELMKSKENLTETLNHNLEDKKTY